MSSLYVEASLQRDTGSVTAPDSAPAWDLTSNTEVIPSPAALLLRQRSYLAVKAEEIGLLSVLGLRRSEELLRGVAENDSKGKASILSWSLHQGWPAAAKPAWCSDLQPGQGLCITSTLPTSLRQPELLFCSFPYFRQPSALVYVLPL